MQINPHFLFNTLHTISALVHEKPEAADRMIARLSDLLRRTLDHSDIQEVPLRETLAGLEEQLPGDRFMRISRSVIVNLDRIKDKEVQPLFYGDHVVILLDGTKLTLSRTHRDRLDKLIERPT